MKVGDSIKPTKVGNHGYIVGKKYTLYQQYNNGGALQPYWTLRDPDSGAVGTNYIQESELEISLTRKDLNDKVKDMEIEIIKNKKMIEYLDNQHKDEIDSIEFFAWYIVQIMESDDPKKTEKISKLLNSVTNSINIDSIITR